MGRSIVYCDKCGKLLKEEEFLQGKAFTHAARAASSWRRISGDRFSVGAGFTVTTACTGSGGSAVRFSFPPDIPAKRRPAATIAAPAPRTSFFVRAPSSTGGIWGCGGGDAAARRRDSFAGCFGMRDELIDCWDGCLGIRLEEIFGA